MTHPVEDVEVGAGDPLTQGLGVRDGDQPVVVAGDDVSRHVDEVTQGVHLVMARDRIEEPADGRHLRVLDLLDRVPDVLTVGPRPEDELPFDHAGDEDPRLDARST